MTERLIRIFPDMQFHRLADGAYTNSVSVAMPNALVVIENLRHIDSETLMADVVITEDDTSGD